MAEPLPVAGWYPDPEFPGHDRWWDGANWTDQRRTAAPVAASAATGTAPGAAAAAGATRGPGLYIPGEPAMTVPPAPAYAPAPIQRNTLALVGFILSASGVVLPFVLNSFAGGIVSIIGLRRSKQLPGNGILSTGRGLSIAGILIGFIWGGLTLLFVVGIALFYWWIFATAQNFQYPDNPVG